ncbi:MAG: MFS transporter [Clostridium luticellarii]|nr:MFS transporter [Clostridium luticellarii]MCI1944228.1 MFS transporter [Clostridium luticellarii]MCI1967730.1 MFS transporter [Clostridium luticellarii]MCI1994821.1 MFS transporter [Clostridium luticellarii]MCI2039694.1 MFS transporter [Clostridium luticellarii]
MLCLALALRQMSMTIVMPFISTYCKSLKGYTPVLAGLAIGVFGLTQAVFQIPFGVLSDEYGNKKMMLIGLTQVAAGLFIAYISKNIGLLILARALQGSGAVIGVGYSWTASMVDEKERISAMSLLGAFISAAAALAFAIGPLLREIISVNLMFLFCAILLSLNELYILFFLKDNKSKNKNRSIQNNQIYTLLIDKNFVIMNIVAFLNNFIMISVFYALPIYLNKVTGETGMWKVFVPAIVIAILAMKSTVKYTRKGFNNQVLMCSFLILSLGLIFYFRKSSYIFLLIGTTIFMCGYITLATVVAADVNDLVADKYRGTANGIFNSFQYIGNFIGAIVTGWLWGISETLTWLILMAVGIIGFLIICLGKPLEESI